MSISEKTKDLLKTIKNYSIIFVIIALLIFGLYYLFAYNNKKKQLQEANLKAQMYLQNLQAYKDSSNMKSEIIQQFAIKVSNLNSENEKLKNRILLLKSNFTLLSDSIKILNELANSHNFGDSIIVEFEGKKGKISYKGKTTYFVVDDKSSYSLSISQDPIKITSILFYDDSTKIIYNKIYADSVLIDDAKTEIDKSFFDKFNTPQEQINFAQSFFDKLLITVEANAKFKKFEEFQYLKSLLELKAGIKYRFENGIIIGAEKEFTNNIWIGKIGYENSIKNLFNLIF